MSRFVISGMIAAVAITIAALSGGCAAAASLPSSSENTTQEQELTNEGVVAYNLTSPDHLHAWNSGLFFTTTGDDNGFPVGQLWRKPIGGGERKLFTQLAYGGPVATATYWDELFFYATTDSPALRRINLDTGVEDGGIANVYDLVPKPTATNRPLGITAITSDREAVYAGVAGGQIVRFDVWTDATKVLVNHHYVAHVVERSVIRIAAGEDHLYWLNAELPNGSPLESELALYAAARDGSSEPRKLAVYKETDLRFVTLATVGDRVFVGSHQGVYTALGDKSAPKKISDRPSTWLQRDHEGLLIVDQYNNILIIPHDRFTTTAPTSGVILEDGRKLRSIRSLTTYGGSMLFLAGDKAEDTPDTSPDGVVLSLDRSKWVVAY